MTVLPDAAFFYQPDKATPELSGRGPYFCVTGSAEIGAYDLKSYVEGIREIARHWNLQPVFTFSRKSDAAVLRAFAELGERNYSVVSSATHPDVDQLLGVLKGAVVVIGGRYHTSISALSQNVPAILTASNSHKSLGLVRMIGESNLPMVAEPGSETLKAAMDHVMADRDGLRARLSEKLEDLRRSAEKASLSIRALVLATTAAAGDSVDSYVPDFTLDPQRDRLSFLRPFSMKRNLQCYDRPRLVARHP